MALNGKINFARQFAGPFGEVMTKDASGLVRIDDEQGGSHWYLDGKRHREDGPAMLLADGSAHWFIHGRRHRDDGPAIVRPNGSLHWYKNGVRHKEDGPAIEYADGDCWWYIEGKLHREDGPAIEWVGGTGSWWLMGIEYTPQTFDTALERLTRLREKERKRAGSIRSLL